MGPIKLNKPKKNQKRNRKYGTGKKKALKNQCSGETPVTTRKVPFNPDSGLHPYMALLFFGRYYWAIFPMSVNDQSFLMHEILIVLDNLSLTLVLYFVEIIAGYCFSMVNYQHHCTWWHVNP